MQETIEPTAMRGNSTATPAKLDVETHEENRNVQWVTRAKRKRIQNEQARQKRQHAREQERARNEGGILSSIIVQERRDAFVDAEVDNESLPFKVHASRKRLVHCGGIVGCENCGRDAQGDTANNALKIECRRYCPPGTRGQMRRLLGGKHPQTKRKAELWPDGSAFAAPKRVRL